ncbi:MAG TPA: zinc ribbon domain-containing protein [Nitrolancea sp.]|nr:zinc ribbon domain-containing protein [Nitrolancea sp.]
MPIYEYRCLTCRKKVSIFFRSYAAVTDPVCPQCGGTKLDRLFSRVVVRRGGSRETSSDESDFGAGDMSGFDDGLMGMGADPYGDPYGDSFDDNPFGFDDDTDPREIARWTRQMSAQIGEPLDADLDAALSDLERGADPDEVMERLEESEPPPVDE